MACWAASPVVQLLRSKGQAAVTLFIDLVLVCFQFQSAFCTASIYNVRKRREDAPQRAAGI